MALGAAVQPLPLGALLALLAMLQQLVGSSQWEVRGCSCQLYLLACIRLTDSCPAASAFAAPKVPRREDETPVWTRMCFSNPRKVRHSGLLALKYVVASRPDAAVQLLPLALDIAQTGLQVLIS